MLDLTPVLAVLLLNIKYVHCTTHKPNSNFQSKYLSPGNFKSKSKIVDFYILEQGWC